MTAFTTAEIWQHLIEGRCPPHEALDILMEIHECERAEAIRMLHEAAADWVERLYLSDPNPQNWNLTIPEAISKLRIGDGDRMRRACIKIRKEQEPVGEFVSDWSEWCDRVEQSLTILRELNSIL